MIYSFKNRIRLQSEGTGREDKSNVILQAQMVKVESETLL